MNLNKYIKQLQNIVKDNPNAGWYTVLYAIDDEGNGYRNVEYTPTIGWYDSEDFVGENEIQDYVDYVEVNIEECPINSICIN